MPKINVKKAFPYSPDGKSVVEIEAGEQEVSERCAEVAVEHLKVATLVGESGGKSKPESQPKPADKDKDAEKPPATKTSDE